MPDQYVAVKSSIITAPLGTVWEALTDPTIVKKYMPGTEIVADWRVGGTVTYRGEWEGKAYEDSATILALEPKYLLKLSYFSPLSGKEDKPENHHTITYELAEGDGQTTLTITQDNNDSQQDADKAAAYWGNILDNLKRLLEQP